MNLVFFQIQSKCNNSLLKTFLLQKGKKTITDKDRKECVVCSFPATPFGSLSKSESTATNSHLLPILTQWATTLTAYKT
jgi:hypothetical protein